MDKWKKIGVEQGSDKATIIRTVPNSTTFDQCSSGGVEICWSNSIFQLTSEDSNTCLNFEWEWENGIREAMEVVLGI